MAAGFTMLLAKIAAVVQWFGNLFVAVFKAAWDMVTDVVCWSLDGLLSVAVAMATSLDLGGITASLSGWGAIPGEVLNVLGLLGAGEAAAIIVSAIGVRLALQLIPFTRLGS